MPDESHWSQRGTRRVTRRGMLLSGGTAAAGLALAACSSGKSNNASGGSTSGSQQSAAQAKQGGTLTFGTATADMWKQTDAHQALIFSIWHLIGQHAIRLDADTKKLVPLAVEKWEVPGDGSEFILHVRPNVKIQNKPPANGRNFNAEDLAWNIMRNGGKLDSKNAALFQRATTMYPLDHAEVVDPLTVKVVMTKPSSTFLAGLTEAHNPMMPKDVVEAGLLNNLSALAGHGPFMVKSYQEGGTLSVVRHPEYWNKGFPYVDQIDWITLPDAATQISAFVSGKTDMFQVPTKEQVATIKPSRPDAKLLYSRGLNWYHIRFHTEKQPFTDVRVRRAIFLALDYQEIGDGAWGDGWEYTGPLAPANPEALTSEQVKQLPGYNPSTKDKDRQTAKQLMAAAGYPDGELSWPILISSPLPTNAAYVNSIRIQDQLKKLWPKMNVQLQPPADGAAFNRLQAAGDFTAIAYTNTSFPDPALELAAQWHSQGGQLGSRNYGKFKNAEADTMIEKALVTLDANARKQILLDFQKRYFDDWMPLIHLHMAPDRYFLGPHFGGFDKLLGVWWFINFRVCTAAEYFWRI